MKYLANDHVVPTDVLSEGSSPQLYTRDRFGHYWRYPAKTSGWTRRIAISLALILAIGLIVVLWTGSQT